MLPFIPRAKAGWGKQRVIKPGRENGIIDACAQAVSAGA